MLTKPEQLSEKEETRPEEYMFGGSSDSDSDVSIGELKR
jgi:hypothetical protein